MMDSLEVLPKRYLVAMANLAVLNDDTCELMKLRGGSWWGIQKKRTIPNHKHDGDESKDGAVPR